MLELPESYTISKQIEQTLKGKRISNIEVLHTPHKFAFFKGDKEKYADYLEGQSIAGAAYHGGLIEINTEDSMIVLGDGAYPKYITDKNQFLKKHQLGIYFDDETALFIAIRMYGEVFIYKKGTCKDGYYRCASQKPNPLTDAFTYEYFKSLYLSVDKKLSVKSFLATEQRIPGLGNGVLQDILWDAGFHPRFDMKNMTEADLHILYTSVKTILKKMVECGGRDTEPDLFGEKGGYVTQLSKNSLNKPCMKCGYEIHKASYLGGAVYFCEHCQKL